MDLASESSIHHLVDSQSNSQPTDQSSEGAGKKTSSTDSYQVFRGAVEKSVNKLTSKNRVFPFIKEHFEPVYRKDSKNVVELFKSMMDQLKTMINEEIDLQLDSSQVEQRLGELDGVKEKGKSVPNTWRPSGDADSDLKAHLHEFREKELEHLEKVYRHLLAKNSLLNASVGKAKQQVASSVHKIDACQRECQEAASAIPETTRQELIKIALELPSPIITDEGC